MRVISLILVILLVFSLTGCWNAREINELALVLSVALDKTDDGFKVTAQMAKPETYSKTPSGGGGGAEKEKPFWIITGTGKTIFNAVRNMASISSRRIVWSHIKVIIIGEELAKNDIQEIFDFFSRNAELRFRTWIAVTPGEAGKILEIVPIMEKDPSLNIEKITEKTNLIGSACGIMLKDFLEDYMDPYLNPVTSRIVLTEQDSKPTVKLEGGTVFNDNKMVGWLQENETRGFLWIENKIDGSIRAVNCPYDGLLVTLEIKSGKTKFKSEIVKGIPHYTITAKATAKLTEKACLTEFTNPKALHDLEKTLASAIQDDIQSTVDAAQNLNSDFIDFSGILHRQHKKDWNKMSSDWTKLFKKAEVKIQVDVRIPEVSLLAKSLVPIKVPANNSR
jgi:spore germination protein KC